VAEAPLWGGTGAWKYRRVTRALVSGANLQHVCVQLLQQQATTVFDVGYHRLGDAAVDQGALLGIEADGAAQP